jgi:hypothetical protein
MQSSQLRQEIETIFGTAMFDSFYRAPEDVIEEFVSFLYNSKIGSTLEDYPSGLEKMLESVPRVVWDRLFHVWWVLEQSESPAQVLTDTDLLGDIVESNTKKWFELRLPPTHLLAIAELARLEVNTLLEWIFNHLVNIE